MCFSQEVLDKLTIKVCEAEESLNISKVAGFRPIGDGGYFTVIHAYMPGFNNHFEVLDVVIVKLAFLGFQV